MRMKRVLERESEALQQCWVMVALKLEFKCRAHVEKKLFVVLRVLLKPTVRFVPH